MSVGAVSSLAGREHTSKCARKCSLFLSFGHSPTRYSPVSQPRDSPLGLLSPRPGIGFQGRKYGGGKKTEKDGAGVFGEVRLPQTRRILRLFFPSPSPPFARHSPPPSPAPSLFFFHFLPMRSYRRDVPTCTSRTEGRKTWVLIRARRGCGSSRHYFTGYRLSLFVCCSTRIHSPLLIRRPNNLPFCVRC